MANRYHTSNSQRSISGPAKGPPAGNTGIRAAMPAAKTASWSPAPGPKGPSWRNGMSGFREIAEGAKQDKADDFNGQGAMSGAASGASMGATVGSVFPVVGTAIGAVVGGIAGLLTGGFGTPKQ